MKKIRKRMQRIGKMRKMHETKFNSSILNLFYVCPKQSFIPSGFNEKKQEVFWAFSLKNRLQGFEHTAQQKQATRV